MTESLHHRLLRELDEAIMSGKIETAFHYDAKKALRQANMSGRPLRTLEEVAAAVKTIRDNGGMTQRQIYNPRYC